MRDMAKAIFTEAIGACSLPTSLATSRCLNVRIYDTPPGILDGAPSAVADANATVKVSDPSVPAIGTIVFFQGGSGGGGFDIGGEASRNGYYLPALARGQRVIQATWQPANGWWDGSAGLMAASCRCATLLYAIWNDRSLHTPGTPFCVVGQSGGAGQIAYPLCHYGAGDFIDLAIIGEGPPFSNLYFGAVGAGDPTWAALGPTLCTVGGGAIQYSGAEAVLIDASYGSRTYVASKAVAGGIDNPAGKDSILHPSAVLSWPDTTAVFIFGDADNTAACPLGRYFRSKVQSPKTEHILTGGVIHGDAFISAGGIATLNSALSAATFNH